MTFGCVDNRRVWKKATKRHEAASFVIEIIL